MLPKYKGIYGLLRIIGFFLILSVNWVGDVRKRQRTFSFFHSHLSVDNIGIVALNIYYTLAAAAARHSEYL